MLVKERYRRVMEWFAGAMPEPRTELHYDTPFHLLLAVILSAQCTDRRVNMVAPALFEAFPDAASLARSDEATVYEYIKSVSYPNNKTRLLLGAAMVFGATLLTIFARKPALPAAGTGTKG